MVQTARGASLPRIGVAFWLPKRRPAAGIDSVARRDNPGNWQVIFYAQSEVNVADPAREDVSDGGGLGRGAAANPWR